MLRHKINEKATMVLQYILGLVFDEFSSFGDDRNDLYNPEFITLMISVMNSGL